MRKIKLFSLAGAAVLLAIGLATLYADKETKEEAPKGGVASILEGKLVVPDGEGDFKGFDFGEGEAPKYFAVYYSAHWCGPCRAFTPELVKFYDAKKKENSDFELIFVSSDTSEDAMYEYMKETGMKFPALRYSERNTSRGVTKYAGPGIPCLVVLDDSGKVLAHSFEGDNYVGPLVPLQKLEKILEKSSSS